MHDCDKPGYDIAAPCMVQELSAIHGGKAMLLADVV
jgi:hypothetical protein